MQKKQPSKNRLELRLRPEDTKLLTALQKKNGIKFSEIVRMGIRKLADAEGLR